MSDELKEPITPPKPGKRAKGPNKFRLANMLQSEPDTEALKLEVDMDVAFSSTAAVRKYAIKAEVPGTFYAVLIRDCFTVEIKTPEPVPVVTVKSVKV